MGKTNVQTNSTLIISTVLASHIPWRHSSSAGDNVGVITVSLGDIGGSGGGAGGDMVTTGEVFVVPSEAKIS